MPKSSPRPTRLTDDPIHWSHWVTRAALLLAVAVVFARSTTLETLRNPLDVTPGSDAVPRGTGPAEGLWLDLLACLPALLVLARRVVDPAYALRFAWSAVPMLLLGAWAVISTRWADDKFAALVSSVHFLAGFVLLWSVAQLVRSWLHLRIVAAACFGLLLVMVAAGGYYKLVEQPDLAAEWTRNGDQILRERGFEPGSFEADQFTKRALGGQLMGFTSSPNSFAAVLVLLSLVTGGLLAQRLARAGEVQRDLSKGAGLPTITLGAAIVLGAALVVFTESRTGMAIAAAGAGTLALQTVVRPLLRRHPTPSYFVGAAAVLLLAAAVVVVGLKTGGLVHVSLTFRWRYWVGGFATFLAHPLLGVGYENFGTHYLAHRLPIAAEEVHDPHDFVVRIFAELGLVGGLLLLVWQLQLWWDLTRPVVPPDPAGSATGAARPGATSAIGTAAVIGAAGLLMSLATSVDFAMGGAYAGLQIMQRVLLAGLFVLGTTLGLVRGLESSASDGRPAPWLLHASILAAGLFLAHNLVDFSFFEPGPMLLFALVVGAALGARTQDEAAALSGRRPLAIATFSITAFLWIAAAALLAAPVTLAESDAAAGDNAIREKSAGAAAGYFRRAAERVPYNADYWIRAAGAMYADGRDGGPFVAEALKVQPMSLRAILLGARAGAARESPDWPAVLTGYRRALEIDPFNVAVRLEFAGALEKAGDRSGARGQFAEALRVNDLLAQDETKRLKPERVEAIRRRMETLGG